MTANISQVYFSKEYTKQKGKKYSVYMRWLFDNKKEYINAFDSCPNS